MHPSARCRGLHLRLPRIPASHACQYQDMQRTFTVTCLLLLALSACSSPEPGAEPAPATAETPTASQTPVTPETPTVSQAPAGPSRSEVIQAAEAAVEGELPDAPIWEGMKFRGSLVDDLTVCVDRTYGPGGGAGGKPGSAGYVIVTFPDETLGQPSLGEPTDGKCSDVADLPKEEPAPPVEVPDSVKDEPGLITRTDLGEEWPLTVDYGVVACQVKMAGRIRLEIATFTAPDGTEYALNGNAKSHTDAADIEPIWAPNPDVDGLKVDIGPLIERARTFC